MEIMSLFNFGYDQQVADCFGIHARALLNDYSCYLEDIIGEHIDDFKVKSEMWQKMRELKAFYKPANNIRAFPR